MDTFLARELEIMAEMPRYYDWIAAMFRDHVKGQVLEIGPGLGALSQRLLPNADHLHLVEPSANLIGELRGRIGDNAKVSVHNQTVEAFLATAPKGAFDAVVMANVLEHIEDDRAVVAGIRACLKPQGKLLIFVPAMPFLYSNLDRAVGHYRRYTRGHLGEVLAAAGFDIVHIRYMDMLGIVPWWIVMTLFGSTTFNRRMVRLYDAVGVPVARAIETRFPPGVGKNVLAVARRK